MATLAPDSTARHTITASYTVIPESDTVPAEAPRSRGYHMQFGVAQDPSDIVHVASHPSSLPRMANRFKEQREDFEKRQHRLSLLSFQPGCVREHVITPYMQSSTKHQIERLYPTAIAASKEDFKLVKDPQPTDTLRKITYAATYSVRAKFTCARDLFRAFDPSSKSMRGYFSQQIVNTYRALSGIELLENGLLPINTPCVHVDIATFCTQAETGQHSARWDIETVNLLFWSEADFSAIRSSGSHSESANAHPEIHIGGCPDVYQYGWAKNHALWSAGISRHYWNAPEFDIQNLIFPCMKTAEKLFMHTAEDYSLGFYDIFFAFYGYTVVSLVAPFLPSSVVCHAAPAVVVYNSRVDHIKEAIKNNVTQAYEGVLEKWACNRVTREEARARRNRAPKKPRTVPESRLGVPDFTMPTIDVDIGEEGRENTVADAPLGDGGHFDCAQTPLDLDLPPAWDLMLDIPFPFGSDIDIETLLGPNMAGIAASG